MKPGLEIRGKRLVGRDPRQMTQDELREAGHEPKSPLQALRAHCLDCCGHQEKEVALCPAVNCPSWPLRMGTDPWRKPASSARREAARRTMTRLNARQRRSAGAELPASPPKHGTAPSPATGAGVARTWGTARVGQFPETEPHRGNGGCGGQPGEKFGEEPVSVGDGVITTAGEARKGVRR